MDTHAYDFLRSARFDRFDILCPRYHDVWQSEVVALGTQARMCAEDAGLDAKYNQRCLGQEADGDKRLYSFETWGAFSDAWAQTVGPLKWAELQRLDIRIECDIDTRKLTGLYGWVSEKGKYGRNVNLFDSREREKKEGRHAGGCGISIGSHKSDRRLVIYKRKGERGAIELQLSGRALQKLVGEALEGYRANPEGPSMYKRMMDFGRAALEKMAREAGFESAHALVRSVGPSAPFVPPADFVAEAPVETLVQSYMNLSADEKGEIVRRLTSDYFNNERGPMS